MSRSCLCMWMIVYVLLLLLSLLVLLLLCSFDGWSKVLLLEREVVSWLIRNSSKHCPFICTSDLSQRVCIYKHVYILNSCFIFLSQYSFLRYSNNQRFVYGNIYIETHHKKSRPSSTIVGMHTNIIRLLSKFRSSFVANGKNKEQVQHVPKLFFKPNHVKIVAPFTQLDLCCIHIE